MRNTKNLAIVVLCIVVVLETGLLVKSKLSEKAIGGDDMRTNVTQDTSRNSAPRPVFLHKGDVLANSPMMKYAYEVWPENVAASKNVDSGMHITIATMPDGSTQVTFTPTDSQDQAQVYHLTQGKKLYFIEQSKADDDMQNNVDKNYRDDYGVIVDANGIVQ